MWIKGYRIDPFTKEKLFSFRNLTIIHGLCKCTCWEGNIESALQIFTTLNGLLLFLNLRFPFGETLRRNKCTKWRNMGKCFHPRKDIKASKRIRVLNSLFVSQVIHKTDNFVQENPKMSFKSFDFTFNYEKNMCFSLKV